VTGIVLDIEANGFHPDTIWCCSVQHLRGQEEPRTFLDAQGLKEFLDGNKGVPLYAHNGLGYDYPILERLWDIDLSGRQLFDTLVLSRLASPSRDGGHSLESWGERLRFPKGTQPDFSRFSEEMVGYCEQDVRVTRRMVQVLTDELKGFDERSITLEHEVFRIIHQQRENGWLVDERGAYVLLATLKERKMELEDEVREVFKPYYQPVKAIQPKYKKDGELSVVGLKRLGSSWRLVGGPSTLLDCPDFNLGSRQQIGNYLIRFGWKPTEFTDKGQPKVDETVLGEVKGIPEATLIAEYLTVQKRIGLVQSWVEAVDERTGRVHGYVNSNGAVTSRMTHSDPNVAQVPANGSPYGYECRELWMVPEGCKLVGADADGLELRMLAHYMDDPEFTLSVTEGNKEDGTDVHTRNQRLAGLPSRDDAKTFIYAFLYGAGDAKIGAIVGGTRHDGAELKEKFLAGLPALSRLKERVERASRRGYLRGLDGRRIYVRSEHAALNTLLQGGGAVVMKQALVNLDRMARSQNLDFRFVGNIHDEIQTEVRAEHAETFGRCASFAIAKAGRDFNLRCPLAAGYDIGDNWAQTH
jgi:DNA polymerase-1